MLNKPPFCTIHAFERAYRRLGLERGPFLNWIDVTFQEWIEVNPRFLLNRNVGIILASDATYHVAPWTANRGVCFVIIDGEFQGQPEKRIISVIDFYHLHEKQIEFRINQDELTDGFQIGRTPIEQIADKLCKTGILSLNTFGNVLGIERNIEGGDVKYMLDFVNEKITLTQLHAILDEPKESREDLWIKIKNPQDSADGADPQLP